MKRNPESRRGGFTLIELVVVVAIIAILTGMLLAGVMRAKQAGIRTQIRDEVSQMTAALAQFKADMKKAGSGNVNVPSYLLIKEDGSYNLANKLELDSFNFFKGCFPKCDLRGPFVSGKYIGLDWSGTGKRNGVYYLEGWQCLVFCLGGVPFIDPSTGTVTGMKGFSTNPIDPTDWTNPTNPSQPRPTLGPFYTFEPKRLNTTVSTKFIMQPNIAFSNQIFPGYNDPYGTPYAFFSSYSSKNGYNRYGTTDCASLVGTDPKSGQQVPAPYPYYQSVSATNVVTYHNPDTVQIISAGKDMLFGPGGLWPATASSPATAPGGSIATATAGPAGPLSLLFMLDDMTNFTSAPLGAGR